VGLEHGNAVCLCVDERMLIPAFFVADGLRKAALHRGLAFDILIFVTAEDVRREHREWAADRGIVLRHDIDISSVRDITIHQSRFSTAMLLRLLVPERLLGHYKKILYLDADLVIKDDVSALLQLDMGDFAIAAVPTARMLDNVPTEQKDWWLAHFRALGMTPPFAYFNSGVMLIDVENWRRDRLTSRTLEFIRTNPSICYLPDEDALNALLDGKVLELSPIWNALPAYFQAIAHGNLHAVIVHYAGPLKPWMRFKKGKGLFQDIDAYRLYEDFIRSTPWSDWLRRQWTMRDVVRAIRHEMNNLFKRLVGKEAKPSDAEWQPPQSSHHQLRVPTRLADVEQGITLREGNRLRLAPAAGPGDSAKAVPISERQRTTLPMAQSL
jgi:lipopolysaccharide biosynthesis glycosyltransferase